MSSKEWIAHLRDQVNPNHSDAAKYWDGLKPEWRGVVLHAASLCGRQMLNASLAECSWRELYARVDHHGMMQLRNGIQKARNTFGGFGTLRERDFAPRTVNHDRQKQPQQIIAPALPATTANLIASRNKLRQQKTQGQQA